MNKDMNPLKQVESLGQSIWLDYISRDLLRSGQLQRLIEEDGLRGMTSNPDIFEKAIGKGHEYDDEIRSMALQRKTVKETYEFIARTDIQNAADIFRPLYERINGKDGHVSLEVDPHLCKNTQGTIEEARRLWKELNRPNVFIKVPGTREGIPAIRQLISEGININVTLLFGLPRYREVAQAYLEGLEERFKQGMRIDNPISVASFFLSRIDTMIDKILEETVFTQKDAGIKIEIAKRMQGQIAIASARMAYQIYKEIFSSERFKKLQEQGASPQRLLWASTSTKNPNYPDVKYIEALIGPDTVNTVPLSTLEAYRDHGAPAIRIENDLDEARWVLAQLPELGINLDDVTEALEADGAEKFQHPFDKLMSTLERIMSQSQTGLG